MAAARSYVFVNDFSRRESSSQDRKIRRDVRSYVARTSHTSPLDKRRRRIFHRNHKITVFDVELGSLGGSGSRELSDNKSSVTNLQQEKNCLWRKQQEQCSLDFSLPLITSAQAVFVELLVDAFAPLSQLCCGRSDSIRIAASQRTSSPLLDQAFQAVSTGYVGKVVGNVDLAATGTRRYLTILHMLQAALSDVGRSRSDSVLLTVVLMMVYESVLHTAEKSLVKHCLGALRLIEHRGPQRHQTGVGHACYIELRPYWVAAALVARRPTFLAQQVWKTVPWSDDTIPKDIMHHLLDIVVHIPAVLAQYDEMTEAVRDDRAASAPTKDGNGRLFDRDRLWTTITDLERQLRQWKRTISDQYPAGLPREVESQGNDGFPRFQCRDLSSRQVYQPRTILYPDPQLARTDCMYYASFLLLSSVDTRPENAIKSQEQYTWACAIWRSMEYYFRNSPGLMINRMAFPASVAYRTLPRDGVERQSAQKIFLLIAREKNLKSWTQMDVNLSVESPHNGREVSKDTG